ncbi:phage terminase small subunit [Streptomyces tsukubensis]
MPRGGHAASGPPPDPNALRRNRKSDASGWRTLPAEGRTGPVPEWPLTEPTDREHDLWVDLWEKPQACAWEDLGQALEVALFVRTLAEAERPDARVDVKKMVRSYLDSLGLSVAGMLRNRWKVAPGPEADAPADLQAAVVPRRRSARDRFKVVPRDGG